MIVVVSLIVSRQAALARAVATQEQPRGGIVSEAASRLVSAHLKSSRTSVANHSLPTASSARNRHAARSERKQGSCERRRGGHATKGLSVARSPFSRTER